MSQANSHRIRPSKQAFTLIELLVVISIIALLVAILLPALRAARTTAQLMQANSQARQVHLMLTLYANDYDQRLMFSSNNPDDKTDEYWSELLERGGYLDDKEILHSPGHDRTLPRSDRPLYTGFGVYHWSTMPTLVDYNNGTVGLPLRFGEVGTPAPSTLMTCVDVTRFDEWNSGLADGYAWAAVNDDIHLFTYNGNVARSYADGHAEAGDSSALGWRARSQRDGDWLYSGAVSPPPWYDRRHSSIDW